MRALIFGPMPEKARPESHIAAGPWCFAGREKLFPGWDGAGAGAFNLPPDPFKDARALDLAARAANATALRLCRTMGDDCRMGHENSAPEEKNLPAACRQLLYGPYFLLAAQVLAERQQRLLDLIALYGQERLRIALPPAAGPFFFQNIRDFMLRGVLNPRFNHVIYARLLQSMAPPTWKLEIDEDPAPDRLTEAAKSSPGTRLRRFLAHRLRNLPFPRYRGFSICQALLLSLAVLSNKRKKRDASLDFSLYCDQEPEWRFDAQRLILDCLPLDLRRASLAVKASLRAPAMDKEKPGPLRGMTAAFMEDDLYRLRLARMLARGCRLFAVQHGANYGNLQSVGILPFEYSRHVFFTWGWQKHRGLPANARPLPHPLLLRLAGRHRERESTLVLVGTEMSSLSYRLKSRPQAGSLPAYRRARTIFLRAMAEGLAGHEARLLYRPYPGGPGALDDEAHMLRALPGTEICRGKLEDWLLRCRLLVLDHYGTTLHQALAADTPLIAFWDRQAWAMEEESEEALERLRKAQILFDSPEEAAAKALALWPQTRAWWQAPERRSARAFWLERYARLTDESGAPLSMAGLTRIWFKSLRNC